MQVKKAYFPTDLLKDKKTDLIQIWLIVTIQVPI